MTKPCDKCQLKPLSEEDIYFFLYDYFPKNEGEHQWLRNQCEKLSKVITSTFGQPQVDWEEEFDEIFMPDSLKNIKKDEWSDVKCVDLSAIKSFIRKTFGQGKET